MINRSKRSQAVKMFNEAFVNAKKFNIKLLVFPEGTRRNTGQIHEFKKGAFMAAINAQLPILPIVFSSYKSFLNSEKKKFESGVITVSVMNEISTEGLTTADVDWLIAETHRTMSLQFNKISKK